MDKTKILFVCLGNICRSPAAQAIMQNFIDEAGLQKHFELDSAGLYGGHAGELPDRRMRVHARQRGYTLDHPSRPVTESDFYDFDLIVAMDDSNFYNLKRLSPDLATDSKIVRMIEYVDGFPGFDSIPDPYYQGAEGFELVLDMLENGCRRLLENLSQKNKK